MQINITNGTITSIQETLSPFSGYGLPSVVTVTGASQSYSSGTLTLTNITSNVAIQATAQVIYPVSFAETNLVAENDYVALTINGTTYNLMLDNFIYLTDSNDNTLVDSNGDYLEVADPYENFVLANDSNLITYDNKNFRVLRSV